MSYKLTQIEHLDRLLGRRSHSRKYYKKARNRKMRYVVETEIPYMKYDGWEY
jgi:hypothetical protein